MATTSDKVYYIIPAPHNRGFFSLLFILATKLIKAYTSTKQGLELLVKLRKQENRYEGRPQGVFENIYSAAHGENSNTKYKIQKLASGINVSETMISRRG